MIERLTALLSSSLPGLGVILGARMLGEFDENRNPYADVKAYRTDAVIVDIMAALVRACAVADHVVATSSWGLLYIESGL